MTTILIVLATLAVLILGLRHKVRQDAIYQEGVNVGSALLGSLGQPGGPDARFIVVRGMPAFKEAQPFEHQKETYLIVSYEAVETSSTVLRRFEAATCRVLAAGRM